MFTASQDSIPEVEAKEVESDESLKTELILRGKQITQQQHHSLRPRTSPYHREGSKSPDSIAETFTIKEPRSERQTKVKLESLERRLRANEKARKEIEGEVEKWKEKAMKNSRRLPDLEVELAEITQSKEEWEAKSQEIEINLRQVTEERDELRQKLFESEEEFKLFSTKFSENESIGNLSDIEKLFQIYHTKTHQLEQENEALRTDIIELNSKLSENQSHVSTLMGHLEVNKNQSQEIHGICKKELEIRQNTENRINHDVTLMNSTINEQRLELEMLRSEIRCLRSYAQETANSNRNNIILLKSAESERKSLLETLVVLLNSDEEPTENNIKKSIRDLVREKNIEQTRRFEAEKKATNAENVLLDQAKQQRNALFRARLSEEEYSKSVDKIEELEQELLASDLERKNLEHRIETLERCITKVSQMLNVNVGTVFDAIFERIEDLVNQESVYRLVISDNRTLGENLIRGIQNVRKEIQKTEVGATSKKGRTSPVSTAAKIIHDRSQTLKTIDKMDKLNKDLLATMTIETMRAADIEKQTLKKKMNEQEDRIRKLEREKKEGERIRSIIAKWERRNVPKPGAQMKKAPSVEAIRPKSQTSIIGLI